MARHGDAAVNKSSARVYRQSEQVPSLHSISLFFFFFSFIRIEEEEREKGQRRKELDDINYPLIDRRAYSSESIIYTCSRQGGGEVAQHQTVQIRKILFLF